MDLASHWDFYRPHLSSLTFCHPTRLRIGGSWLTGDQAERRLGPCPIMCPYKKLSAHKYIISLVFVVVNLVDLFPPLVRGGSATIYHRFMRGGVVARSV